MSKSKETLELEEYLYNMCCKKRIYGCSEVTIGFHNAGRGNEIVDYATMDSKGILRCYEIKVSLSDLKSNAKKSWYGHYNYLYVTEGLYGKIKENLAEYIPDYVGVAIPSRYSWGSWISIVRDAKRQELTSEQEIMLKESMVRSMWYKMAKYKDTANLDKLRELKKEARDEHKKAVNAAEELHKIKEQIFEAESFLQRFYNKDVDLGELVYEVKEHILKLPEKIELSLTDRGKDYNSKIE